MENLVDYYTTIVLVELVGVGFNLDKWSRLKTWFDGMQAKVKKLLTVS